RGRISTGAGTPDQLDGQLLEASRDRSRILVYGPAVAMYTAATDSFGPPRSFGPETGPFAGLDATGEKVVLDPGTKLLDEELNVLATVPRNQPGEADGLVVDDAGATAYRTAGDAIERLDLSTHRVTASVYLPDSPRGLGALALSGDGSTVVVTTDHGVVVVPTAALVPVPSPCVPPPPYPTVTVCGRLADLAVSADGYAYVSNPTFDRVEVIALATGALEAPIPVGSRPNGLDLSPDGRTLYVANAGIGEISVVDTVERRELRRVTLPAHPHPDWDRPFTVAVAANGTALVSTTLDGIAGGARLLQLDLATETWRPRSDFVDVFGGVQGGSVVRASVDHRLVTAVLRMDGWHEGRLAVYSAATDSFAAPLTLSGPGEYAAAAGGSTVVAGPGSKVFGPGPTLRASVAGIGFAFAVDATGTIGYRAAAADQVEVLDLVRGTVAGSIPMPDGVAITTGSPLAVTPDGARLVGITGNGLSVVGTEVVPRSGFVSWTQPQGPTLVDGYGVWVVPGNDPVARPGQLPPRYLHASYVTIPAFTGGPALGVTGLVTQPEGKFAVLGIVDPEGVARSVGVRFDWRAGRAYYLLTVKTGPASFAASVYDNTAATWTYLGQVDLPAPVGRMFPPHSRTVWFGPLGRTCSVYPLADAYLYPAVLYTGTTTSVASVQSSGTTEPGHCDASATTELAPWVHLRQGAALG
ncbi:MAG TPA: hypothetical protein VF244_02660, partial [Acidimicrobiales bacterium]